MSGGEQVAVVIDDDPDVRRLLGSLLGSLGYVVAEVGDGQEGIDAVRRHRPVLTTLDIGLPGVDGVEIARQIRSFSDTAIVMVTGRTDEIDVVFGLENGADAYIAKPFRSHEFRARIDAMMRRTGRPRPPRPATPPPVPSATASAAPAVPAAPVQPREPRLPARPAPTPDPLPSVPPAIPRTATPERASIRERPQQPTQPAPEQTRAAPTPAEPSRADQTPAAEAALPPVPRARRIEVRGLVLDPDTRQARLDGRPLELSDDQFGLLFLLLDGERRVHTRAALARHLIGADDVTEADKRRADALMGDLCATLDERDRAARWIERLPAIGYRR
ncbi:MAG: response regulator, partial [Nocardioides sp.]|uniref:response regulator transcription factor n=1 Tax=Nocardioides sp. TaxID=35761 RepID=UPI0039E68CE3